MNTPEITLPILQTEVKEWARMNFPHSEPYQPLLGVAKEVGELCHAHLKDEQGIRTDQNHKEAKWDAVGDIVVYLAHYCVLNGISLQGAVSGTWRKVKQRDWQKDRTAGGEPVA